MKIFGITITTKRELRNRIKEMEQQICEMNAAYAEAIQKLTEKFPFEIGQMVYDVQLRSKKGRYTTKNASIEHSLINDVIVTEKNYFGLVKRMRNNDVFTDYDAAKEHLINNCKE